MQINSQTDINFQARNKTIRIADDIARRVNTCYPRISPSIVDDFVNIKAFRKYQKSLRERIEECRKEICDSFYNANNYVGKFIAFTKPIKKHKIGNCGESAQLANIAAKINGIKNCYIASLKTTGGKNLDHSVLYVENEGKPYIIDAWLGFADYVPNAKNRFQNEYRNHFYIEEGDKLVFKKLDNAFTEYLNQDLEKGNIKKLKKIFSEQVKKRQNK